MNGQSSMEGSFPGHSVVKSPPANAGDMGSIPDPEDPTCLEATKPECYNYWACALEPRCLNDWSPKPWGHVPQQEKPLQWEAHTLQPEIAPALCN